MLSNKWDMTDNVYGKVAGGLPIFYEYASRYRRVVVLGVGSDFELRVTYKGVGLKSWSKRYGVRADAIAWAKAQADNREIILGCLTIREAPGKRII